MMIMDEAYVCSAVLYCQGEGCCAFSLVSNSYNNQVALQSDLRRCILSIFSYILLSSLIFLSYSL